MNEIFENNSVITRAYNFYNTYRALIIGITAVVVISISVFFALDQINKANNEKEIDNIRPYISSNFGICLL